ncbi:MAG: hypothetical protein H8E72_04430 [Candidatus Marinimicrobia bacterium]|nr:hypothetical protein [Candidatus Neomarinimicrobiota bacterium]
MITLATFTFKRTDRLLKCLQTIDSIHVNEILIFNDDETEKLTLDVLGVDYPNIKIFNPSDWNFTGRKFRKPIYLNKAINVAKNDKVLFSDDDGRFNKGAIDLHHDTLDHYNFSAGAIIRDRFLNRVSRSILQGTNYAFNKSLFTKIGGYDEAFCNSMGGGDVDFWYRLYNYCQLNNEPCAFLPTAIQMVTGKGSRVKKNIQLNPREYTLEKHGLNLSGPMYKWFPDIRDKKKWMTIING